jgi:hypothetical protein
MEDAYLTIMNFHDNPNLDLFAVFDGHGGNFSFIQDLKLQSLSNNSFLDN